MHLKTVTLHPEKFPTTEHYPFNLALLCETANIVFTSPVTCFVGENGSGKSTLLEAITRKCGVMIWQGITRPRYQASPYEKELYKAIELKWQEKKVPGSFFGSHIFRNFAQLWDEWLTMDPGLVDFLGGESFMSKSHGQSLMAFFKSRFQIKGIYFLDEPETALSPKSQVELLKLIDEMSRAGHAQFIIATHSPILLACPKAQLLSFDTSPVRQIDYKQTDHYRVYKDFMADPWKYLTN
jgi:predicted ATPase